MQFKRTREIIKGTLKEFSRDRVLQLSAALAYYATFSIGPLLVLIIGVVGLIMGRSGAQHQVHGQLQSVLGPKTASMLDSMMSAGHSLRGWISRDGSGSNWFDPWGNGHFRSTATIA